jgi:ABC-type transport system substrate-binding protein
MSSRSRLTLIGAGLLATLSVSASVTASATGVSAAGASTSDAGRQRARVPAATLSPVQVPGTTPMAAAAVDLRKRGYAEREFYATGRAHRYRGAVTGARTDAQVIDGGWDYKTRALVRWPKARPFNGTLVVEWFNVTAGQDADFAWAESHEHLLRQGYAFAAARRSGSASSA